MRLPLRCVLYATLAMFIALHVACILVVIVPRATNFLSRNVCNVDDFIVQIVKRDVMIVCFCLAK